MTIANAMTTMYMIIDIAKRLSSITSHLHISCVISLPHQQRADTHKIFNIYSEIIKSTICNLAREDLESFTFKIELKDSIAQIKSAIGFFFYLLQADGLIKLTQSEPGRHYSIRKFQFTGKFDQFKSYFDGYICDLGTSAYGELGL